MTATHGSAARRFPWPAALGRVVAGAALLTAVGLLPWLSGTDPALTVLRARSADQDPTAQQLDAIRAQLDLDQGPLAHLLHWLGGDAGVSWVSGEAVLPQITTALSVSLTLMLGALVVTLLVAALVCARTVVLGSRRRLGRGRTGTTAAVLASLPKFLLASVLATVCGVWWGWFPSSGWEGPQWMVLPSLALGIPSGAMIGGMLDQSLPAAFHEPWARTAHACGLPPSYLARNALRRTLPGVLPQFLPTVVALVGGAVAVEKIFNIPGLGRLALDSAIAQDLPVLQTTTLALVLLGVAAGVVVRLLRHALLGRPLRDGALPTLHRPRLVPPRSLRWIAGGCALVLVGLVVAGLLRDPLHVDTAARLLRPSAAHPLGTDSLGRDLLARLGHGALRTAGVAFGVTAVSALAGLLLGMVPRASAGLTEVVSTLPAVLAGLLIAGVTGPSVFGAACAVCAVGWTPYAAQTAALLEQERASGHIAASVSLGAGRAHLLRRHLLPAVGPALLRNALLRLPTTVLVLASLGFLGLGEQPPTPEWGRLLSENQPYVELAPWTVLGPAGALILLSVLAVTGSTLGRRER
ncbi:ABC transporter permease component [Streptomyces lincolnensis]|uniref:ABC transporter permease component n=1 Tax=Streptomyces lincolnensis TaxID=1915 RepID=A0A1B1M2L9_STRLN|nr:ABC transporter permease subunit [Streptomyces lincolnensis]ANS62895.1 ABC transporter permease component [Streptomyces lincolnensis]AXG51819.1 ABC transporter permease component [Streptomyces lincolnensis]QMV04825.1 ABC transporter permease subunit [Streptomyces lincolnensis]